MAISEMTSDAGDFKERATNLVPLTAPVSAADSSSKPIMEKSPTANLHGRSANSKSLTTVDPKNWPTMEEFVNPTGPYIRKWNIVFIVSCVLAVLLDPLFLYIPTIKDDLKCVRLDKNLMIAALVFRSFTDLFYLLNIFLQVYGSKTCSTLKSRSCSPLRTSLRKVLLNTAKTMWGSRIIIDILAVLPLPQVAILIMFSKMRGSSSPGTRKFMNFVVILQYVPRVLRIYLSCKQSKNISKEETPIWLKGVLNFFMYILASHVLGALWYFFAVQQITSCWRHACRNENGCDPNNFDCHNHHTLRNIKSLNDLCPVDQADAGIYDFGIYLQVLQFGLPGSTNYSEKFSNCFWWGLRNLSSLGSNLQPSINTWENLFAACISIIGLLLFLYLIGNLQTYMQLDTNRLETHRWDMRIAKKLEQKSQELDLWLPKNGIPMHKKKEIMDKILPELKENRDVEIDNILSILPLRLQSYMKSCMPLNRLKEVPSIKNMDEAVRREISKYLEPQKYKKEDIIIEEDQPLVMMLFIVDGSLSIEKRGCSSTLQRGPGESYGEQLLSWPAWTSSPGLSNESVRAIGDVELLVLTTSDVERVGSKFRSEFVKRIASLSDAKWELLETDKVALLRKVPKLRSMDTHVLKAISQHLKPVNYNYNQPWLILRNRPLSMMFFIIKGSVLISDDRTSEEEYDGDGYFMRGVGYFFGEELLDWVLDRSFPALLPQTGSCVRSHSVDVLVLMANDLASVASVYKSNFTKVINQQTDLYTARRVFCLKKVHLLKDMDEAVLREIAGYLKPQKYCNDIIIQKDKPLTIMFFLVSGHVTILSKAQREPGYFYGEELLYCPSGTSMVSPVTVKADNDVEVFVLKASDIKRMGHKCKWDAKDELTNTRLVAMLRKVPKLETMDIEVLKAMSLHLKHMNFYSNEKLIEEDKPLRMMIFVGLGSACISNRTKRLNAEQFVGEELLDWVLDTSFPALLPISTYDVVAQFENVYAFVLMADDLASIVSEYRSDFSKVIIPPPTDIVAALGLYRLKKVPTFRNMDEDVLKEICKHMTHMSYSNGTVIIEELRALDRIFFLIDGDSISTSECRYEIGEFYGLELVHWTTNWASHTDFPTKLPVSPCSVRVDSNGIGNAEVLVLRADDLRCIVSKFKSEFTKQTTLSIASEGKLATSDTLTMLKEVTILEDMADQVLQAMHSHLKPMTYSDDTPDGPLIFKSMDKIDKMFFIIRGLVSFTEESKPTFYRYSGNYFGEQLLEWVLDHDVDEEPRMEFGSAFSCVGEVEVLVLTAEDLDKVVSEFGAHFVRQITPSFLMDSE